MTFASYDFKSKAAFRRAVRGGQPVVLFNPELGVPVINGGATVVGPWDIKKHDHKPVHVRAGIHGDVLNHGWQARVVVRDMQVVEVLG